MDFRVLEVMCGVVGVGVYVCVVLRLGLRVCGVDVGTTVERRVGKEVICWWSRNSEHKRVEVVSVTN